MRGLTKGRLSRENAAKREKFVAFLWGRYRAITEKHLAPGTETEHMREAAALRMRLRIRWGGDGGVRKVAAIIRRVETKAVRDITTEAACDSQ